MRFLQPSKRDTEPISSSSTQQPSPAIIQDEEEEYNQYINKCNRNSQYDTSILLDNNVSHGAETGEIELELSFVPHSANNEVTMNDDSENAHGSGNNNTVDGLVNAIGNVSTILCDSREEVGDHVGSSVVAAAQSITPTTYSAASTNHQEGGTSIMSLSRKNLASLFQTASEEEDDSRKNSNLPNKKKNEGVVDKAAPIAGAAAPATDIERKNSTTQQQQQQQRMSTISENPHDNKFPSRVLRRNPSKKSTTKSHPIDIDTNLIDPNSSNIYSGVNINNAPAATHDNGTAAHPTGANPHPAVPQFIDDYGDEASMPSMLTEPDIQRARSCRLANQQQQQQQQQQPSSSSPGHEDDNVNNSRSSANNNRSSSNNNNNNNNNSRRRAISRVVKRASLCSPQQQSLAGMTSGFNHGDDESTIEEQAASDTFFGLARTNNAAVSATTTTGGVATTNPMTFMSSAARAGGIDKLLSAFACSEDTTLGSVVGKVLKCEPVCGGRVMENDYYRDEVDLELEGEEKFALDFQSDIIQNGIKLIFHESPTRASTNPDWIQSTIKLFLRPGNCHGAKLKQPTLAWAVLPVVSRMRGTFDSAEDAGDENRWNMLGLLDVHSILTDETTNNDTGGSVSKAAAANNAAALSTGFFSITAKKTGAVYVFEAPTSKQRDYVVRGIRSVISRLTYHMIAGDAIVIGELFSEDAGQLTGELPSLVSPWKAVGRVTHGFLDQL